MKGLSVPGLAGFWDKLKKWGKKLGTAVATYIGGPMGGALFVTAWNLTEDIFDGGGFSGGWGYGGYGGGLFDGMNSPVLSDNINLEATVGYTVLTYLKKFENWFIYISPGLKGSESKSVVLSDGYRDNVNEVIKKLESYRIYLQVKKNASDVSGMNSPVNSAAIINSRKWKDKEDLVNAFKKAVWDAYIDVLKTHGVTAHAKLINFEAPKIIGTNEYPEPFDWDKSKNYTSELLVFTDSSEGKPAEHLYEGIQLENSPVFDPNTGDSSVIDNLEKIEDFSNQFESVKSNATGNNNPTTTTQNPTENNQTGTPKTETENNKIFGLPKPLAYLIGGSVLAWPVISKAINTTSKTAKQ